MPRVSTGEKLPYAFIGELKGRAYNKNSLHFWVPTRLRSPDDIYPSLGTMAMLVRQQRGWGHQHRHFWPGWFRHGDDGDGKFVSIGAMQSLFILAILIAGVIGRPHKSALID